MKVSDMSDMSNTVVVSANKDTAEGFAIADTPEFYQILSRSLYKNPLKAFVQEVICNAWDIHIETGKTDVPLEITLNDALIVSDSGSGIPHDKIPSVYCTYGKGTKQNQSAQSGGFGLGCKSPFAYGDTFTVINEHDGTKVGYLMRLSDPKLDGKPSCTKLYSLPTDRTGITVIVPLKRTQDIYRIQTEVEGTLGRGDILANFSYTLDDTEQKTDFPYLEMSRDSYSHKILPNRAAANTFHLDYGEIYVRYGNITYPVQENEYYEKSYGTARKILEILTEDSYATLVVQAPDDSLAITPNREEISYQQMSLDTIDSCLEQFAIESVEEYLKILDAHLEPFLKEEIKDPYTVAGIYLAMTANKVQNSSYLNSSLAENLDSINARLVHYITKSTKEKNCISKNWIKGIKYFRMDELKRIVTTHLEEHIKPTDPSKYWFMLRSLEIGQVKPKEVYNYAIKGVLTSLLKLPKKKRPDIRTLYTFVGIPWVSNLEPRKTLFNGEELLILANNLPMEIPKIFNLHTQYLPGRASLPTFCKNIADRRVVISPRVKELNDYLRLKQSYNSDRSNVARDAYGTICLVISKSNVKLSRDLESDLKAKGYIVENLTANEVDKEKTEPVKRTTSNYSKIASGIARLKTKEGFLVLSNSPNKVIHPIDSVTSYCGERVKSPKYFIDAFINVIPTPAGALTRASQELFGANVFESGSYLRETFLKLFGKDTSFALTSTHRADLKKAGSVDLMEEVGGVMVQSIIDWVKSNPKKAKNVATSKAQDKVNHEYAASILKGGHLLTNTFADLLILNHDTQPKKTGQEHSCWEEMLWLEYCTDRGKEKLTNAKYKRGITDDQMKELESLHKKFLKSVNKPDKLFTRLVAEVQLLKDNSRLSLVEGILRSTLYASTEVKVDTLYLINQLIKKVRKDAK